MTTMKFGSVLPLFVAYLVFPSALADPLVIKSNAVTEINRGGSSLRNTIIHRIRNRRSDFTVQEIDEIVTAHNVVRRLESSSNMEVMKWNSYLASMAKDWADQCVWGHGQPPRDPTTVPFNPLGQNLYAISGDNMNLTGALRSWYNEKDDFNYDTLACTPNQMCGHYTQVVWAASREVGCAYAFCPELKTSALSDAYYLVCNYGPAGNYIGEKPYVKGTNCTDCESGFSWCDDGLCNRDCVSPGSRCDCAVKCQNCGTPNTATCSCSCAPGWHGSDCSQVCENTDSNCDPAPGAWGWPPEWCDHPTMGKTVREKCPLMCKLCQVADATTTNCNSANQPID